MHIGARWCAYFDPYLRGYEDMAQLSKSKNRLFEHQNQLISSKQPSRCVKQPFLHPIWSLQQTKQNPVVAALPRPKKVPTFVQICTNRAPTSPKHIEMHM